MPIHVQKPTIIKAAGNMPKTIKEYVGRVNTSTPGVSIALMQSPSGWVEPAQRPDFDEYTLVIGGTLQVTSEDGNVLLVNAGEAVIAPKGEWVQYSTPGADGATYVAVCLPAFSPDTVHREA